MFHARLKNLHRTIAAAIVCLSIGFAGPALAHHSANAVYDLSKTIEMQGKLIKFANINPHAAWHFEVQGADGKVQKWEVMSAAPSFWRGQGLKLKEDIKPGQIYKFKVSPSHDTSRPLALMREIEVKGKWIGSPTL